MNKRKSDSQKSITSPAVEEEGSAANGLAPVPVGQSCRITLSSPILRFDEDGRLVEDPLRLRYFKELRGRLEKMEGRRVKIGVITAGDESYYLEINDLSGQTDLIAGGDWSKYSCDLLGVCTEVWRQMPESVPHRRPMGPLAITGAR